MGNCALGSEHWQRLWDNRVIRDALIEEDSRLKLEQQIPLMQGLRDLYVLHDWGMTLIAAPNYKKMEAISVMIEKAKVKEEFAAANTLEARRGRMIKLAERSEKLRLQHEG